LPITLIACFESSRVRNKFSAQVRAAGALAEKETPMKKHLAWIVPIAVFALAGPRVYGGEDGPALFVIPQRQTSSTHPAVKNTSPTQADAKKSAPAQPVIKKTTAIQPAVEKQAAPKTVPDSKTPYTVNRPVTMPSQMPNNLASRSLDRILSGAGSGTIGPYQARLELRPNGTFFVTGKIEGSGTWHQNGQTIVMESQTSHYEGTLENSSISGTRTFKGRDGIQPWKFVLNDRALEIKLQLQGR
jgi:hypothetical protein